jgi:enoyl-CoA hydratase
MKVDGLNYRMANGIVTITIDRDSRKNAISEEMEVALHEMFDVADRDRDARVIVLTGTGNTFCSGYDVGSDNENRADPTGRVLADYVEYWQRHDARSAGLWSHMWNLGKPIIASVNGWALGGGFWYVLAADMAIASDRAVFGQPEVRHISRTSFLFGVLAGWKNANRWALTGDHFDAQEAYRLGLVSSVVPHESLHEETLALAERIVRVPEPSVRLNKALMMRSLQAAGLQSGLIVDGAISALAHVSHHPRREELFEIQRTKGTRDYLHARDGPFQPEPMGPRSKKR